MAAAPNLLSFAPMKPQGTQLSLFETRSSSDPFAVRVSARARRLTARVHVGGRVEIVVPLGVNARTVREFVQRFTPWIDRKVAAMQCFARCRAAALPPSIEFAFTGERFEVEWQSDSRRSIALFDGRLLVRAPNIDTARLELRGWLKQAAAERLTPALWQLADDLNYSIERVVIRCQRTMLGQLLDFWGTVSLNCSLVFLRPEVVRYLFRARAGAYQAHESLGKLLAPGTDARAGLPPPRTGSCWRGGARCSPWVFGSVKPHERAPSWPSSHSSSVSDEPVHWDLTHSLSYSQYLNLRPAARCAAPAFLPT